ncbi:hypothetical protein [Arachnia rubra]|jgi:hypothetical protein|uniref:Uncharacterized protein n=1 Tax=Arachnia rubra TaxID=1547448 RepID=A0ABX7Y4E5_9ACTN|nr:hypothetical protein [Arachnia rubra]MBB1570380.1 hypothetical protein [Propionibacterium sp.]MDO4645310.1 hypothetical protein [Propionibacteriaceae bacterium]QUC07618.1 hypothetical protein J5A65_11865 [Arachnia rubra]BCR81921.1 hypothetical protein SK1NUM_23640 [Arachnia rubra]
MKGHIRKATVALAAASVLGFVGCSGSSAEPSPADPTETLQMSADYPVYSTLDEAGDAAGTIVRGKFLDSRVELLYPDTSPDNGDGLSNPQSGVPSEQITPSDMAVVATVSRLEVTEALKGDARVGDVIEVIQPGGEYEQVKYTEEKTVPLSDISSSDILLFLDLMPDGHYDLINPEQGLYTVNGDALTPVTDENSLGLKTLAQARETASK